MKTYTVTIWLSGEKSRTIEVQAAHAHDAIGRALGAIEPGAEIQTIVFNAIDGKPVDHGTTHIENRCPACGSEDYGWDRSSCAEVCFDCGHVKEEGP